MKKKDGVLAAPNKPINIRPKRKRSQADTLELSTEEQDTIPKRAKKELTAVKESVPLEQTESQVLKPRNTAAVRATKHYRAKKGRNSSPVVPERVDYDAIPEDTHPLQEEALPAKSQRRTHEMAAANGCAKVVRQTRATAKSEAGPEDSRIREDESVNHGPPAAIQPASAIDNAEMKTQTMNHTEKAVLAEVVLDTQALSPAKTVPSPIMNNVSLTHISGMTLTQSPISPVKDTTASDGVDVDRDIVPDRQPELMEIIPKSKVSSCFPSEIPISGQDFDSRSRDPSSKVAKHRGIILH